MIRNASFTVTPAESGERLDGLLAAHFPTSTRTFCRRAIEDGLVTINNAPCLKGVKLRANDTVSIQMLVEQCDNRVLPAPDMDVTLVYCDEALIAASKPAGQAVHPNSCTERDTLMNGLVARYPELAEIGDQPLMAGALHRIDGETSGLVLAARTPATFQILRDQFVAQTVKKIYYALVEGHVPRKGLLKQHLAHHPKFRGKMVDAKALTTPDRKLYAETTYEPIERLGPYTLLKVTIFTGVTHQIRCQLSLAGFPIVNDTLYGGRPLPNSTRHYLHAAEVHLLHPLTREPLTVVAPLSPDFAALITQLKGN